MNQKNSNLITEITKTIDSANLSKNFYKSTVTQDNDYINLDLQFKYPEDDIVDWIDLTFHIWKHEDHYDVSIQRSWPSYSLDIKHDQIYRNKNIRNHKTILRLIKKHIEE